MGITTGIYVIREFSPELKRLFRHRKAEDMHAGEEMEIGHSMPREEGAAAEQP